MSQSITKKNKSQSYCILGMIVIGLAVLKISSTNLEYSVGTFIIGFAVLYPYFNTKK